MADSADIHDFAHLTHQELLSFTPAMRDALCAWLRSTLISIVSTRGGHLGANLGMVELTVALHTVFDTAVDRILFDVGHQAYAHKILTERFEGMHHLRTDSGVSGFTKRSESVHDAFGAGHSSTSISAALGFAKARDFTHGTHAVLALIGDGAMSAGMAFEALNNARSANTALTVILNDNGMSISSGVGAMSAYFARLFSSPSFQSLRDSGVEAVRHLPKIAESFLQKAEEIIRNRGVGKGVWFEELGFYYIGLVDGHDTETLISVLSNIRDTHKHTPVLLHVRTQKGKGYLPAEQAPDSYHGVGLFSPDTGVLHKSSARTYTHVFTETLLHFAKHHAHLVAITAAMSTGTGLDSFAALYPKRFFDVGIAEQHAVTFAAGMACTPAIIPVVALYSTFVQRALDQIIHDVDLQSLPVRFMVDRSGFVGEDGMTHAGVFDLSLIAHLSSFIIMAAADAHDLSRMIATSIGITHCPSMVRYPRGTVFTLPPLAAYTETADAFTPLPIGRGRVLTHGQPYHGKTLVLLSLGQTLSTALALAERFTRVHGCVITVADARFVKPLDTDLIATLAQTHTHFVILEEHMGGGFASLVLTYLTNQGFLDTPLVVRSFHIPDIFIAPLSLAQQRRAAGLDEDTLYERLCALLAIEATHA